MREAIEKLLIAIKELTLTVSRLNGRYRGLEARVKILEDKLAP